MRSLPAPASAPVLEGMRRRGARCGRKYHQKSSSSLKDSRASCFRTSKPRVRRARLESGNPRCHERLRSHRAERGEKASLEKYQAVARDLTLADPTFSDEVAKGIGFDGRWKLPKQICSQIALKHRVSESTVKRVEKVRRIVNRGLGEGMSVERTAVIEGIAAAIASDL